MNSGQRAVIITTMLNEMRKQDSWCGETHIQKAVYFLQELHDVDKEFDFVLYKHGPYSFELHDELVSMQSDGLLRTSSQAGYGPRIVPTREAEELTGRYPKTVARYKRMIMDVAELIGSMNVTDLEKYATALWVVNEFDENEDEDILEKRVCSIKPHLTREEAREAIKWVDEALSERD